MNKSELRITRSGYVYYKGKRVSELKLTPFTLGTMLELVPTGREAFAKWINVHYAMCAPTSSGNINSYI